MDFEYYTVVQKKQLVTKEPYYHLIEGQLYKLVPYEIFIRCVLKHEMPMILVESCDGVMGGNYACEGTSQKVLRAGFW